jgi:hypothetical protein
MIQRQLQWLWTFKIKIGMDASSCGKGTTHSLSADTKIASQDALGASQQLIDARAYPSFVAAYLQQMQALPQRDGETFEEGLAGELNAPTNDHQLNVCHAQLSERFGGAEPYVADRNDICDGARPNPPFSLAEAKNISRAVSHHGVNGVGVEANLLMGEANLIQQVARGGERRIAAQRHVIDGTDKLDRRQPAEEESVRRGAKNQTGAPPIDQSDSFRRAGEAVHQHGAVVENTHAIEREHFFGAGFIYAFPGMHNERQIRVALCEFGGELWFQQEGVGPGKI